MGATVLDTHCLKRKTRWCFTTVTLTSVFDLWLIDLTLLSHFFLQTRTDARFWQEIPNRVTNPLHTVGKPRRGRERIESERKWERVRIKERERGADCAKMTVISLCLCLGVGMED